MHHYTYPVFFEKLRIKQGKRKTKDREIMEDLWAAKRGVNIKTVWGFPYMGNPSGRGFMFDKYGKEPHAFTIQTPGGIIPMY